MMLTMQTTRVLTGVVMAAALAVSVLAQQTVPPEAQRHIDAARALAGAEHQAVWQTVCNSAIALAGPAAPRGGGGGARGAGGGAGAGAGAGRGVVQSAPATPGREPWYAPPAKVFDNLYFVGMTQYSAWAITTSQGIILLDAIFDYS